MSSVQHWGIGLKVYNHAYVEGFGLMFIVGGLTREKAHEHQHLIPVVMENLIVEWIKVQGRRGVPVTYRTLTQYVSEITGKHVGTSWPKRFMKRHPNIKIKNTVPLEKARAKALNKDNVDGFFSILKELLDEYTITLENIWNMDEKGIQLGIGVRTAVLVEREQKLVYSIEDGNREFVTVIEAVCADGTAMCPSIIFQGQRRNPEWGRDNPCNARQA